MGALTGQMPSFGPDNPDFNLMNDFLTSVEKQPVQRPVERGRPDPAYGQRLLNQLTPFDDKEQKSVPHLAVLDKPKV